MCGGDESVALLHDVVDDDDVVDKQYKFFLPFYKSTCLIYHITYDLKNRLYYSGTKTIQRHVTVFIVTGKNI